MPEAIPTFSNEPCAASVNGAALEVIALTSQEQLSQLFRFEIKCVMPAPFPALASLIDADASIFVRDGFGAEQQIEGIVYEADASTGDHDKSTLSLVIGPPLVRLTLGRNCRVYQDMTVVDITRDVLGRAGIEARFAITGNYPRHPYIAQYREDDWTFVSRLLEQEGIYYWFDHAAGSIVVFSDRSPAAPDLEGGATIRFRSEDEDQRASSEYVSQFDAQLRLMPAKFSVRSFDPNRPELEVAGTSGDGLGEVYDAPGGGPVEPAEAARQATIRAEHARAHTAMYNGRAHSVRLTPGAIMSLREHHFHRFDQRYLVRGRQLSVEQRRHNNADVATALSCRFDCIDAAKLFRPSQHAPPARQPGLQTAQVVGPAGEEVHPNDKGHVRVQMHWDREGAFDDRAGRWVRVAQRGTADSMLLPRIGWNALVVNEEGSVNEPVLLSRIFDGTHPPTYALPANKTRVAFRTATTPGDGTFNELRFEDKAGGQELFINATKDMTALVQNNKQQSIVSNSQWATGNNSALEVGNNAIQRVMANRSMSVGGNHSESTGTTRSEGVAADETITIGGNRNIDVGATLATNVTGTRKLMVAGSQIEVSLGDITAGSEKMSVLVGGAMIRLSAQTIAESVGINGNQLVGGAKIELAAKGLKTGVRGAMLENVGGAMLMTATRHYVERARTALSYQVGGAIVANAPAVVVNGDATIKVSCGGSSVTVTSSNVTFKAPSIDLSGTSIDANGAIIECN